MSLLFRVDIGPAVGSGHLMRMIALATAAKKFDATIRFVTGDLPGTLVRKIKNLGAAVEVSPHAAGSTEDANAVARIAGQTRPQWIVLDGYCFGDEYQQTLLSATKTRRASECVPRNRTNSLATSRQEASRWHSQTKLLVVDDYGHGEHAMADLILNQNVYADSSQYSQSNCDNTTTGRDTQSRVICGPRFTMLREEFASLATAPKRGRSAPEVSNVLVTFGGSDSDNWTLKAMQTIVSSLKQDESDIPGTTRTAIDVVLGSSNVHEPTIRDWMQRQHAQSQTPIEIRLHRNVDRMDTLMRQADLAISGGGSTCYELCQTGVPTIAIATVDNQVPVVTALQERVALIAIVAADGTDAEAELARELRGLLQQPSRRSQLSANGQRLLDGQGARRVARRMLAETLQLRAATLDDAQLLFDWRNEAAVVAASFSATPESIVEHQRWLQHSLKSQDDRAILIVSNHSGDSIGKVQFDLAPTGEATIGISIDSRFRQRGLGTTLIEEACRWLTSATNFASQATIVRAEIKPENSASRTAFSNAGFHETHHGTVKGQPSIVMHLPLEPNMAVESTPVKKAA